MSATTEQMQRLRHLVTGSGRDPDDITVSYATYGPWEPWETGVPFEDVVETFADWGHRLRHRMGQRTIPKWTSSSGSHRRSSHPFAPRSQRSDHLKLLTPPQHRPKNERCSWPTGREEIVAAIRSIAHPETHDFLISPTNWDLPRYRAWPRTVGRKVFPTPTGPVMTALCPGFDEA